MLKVVMRDDVDKLKDRLAVGGEVSWKVREGG